jgi:hypothetical protein
MLQTTEPTRWFLKTQISTATFAAEELEFITHIAVPKETAKAEQTDPGKTTVGTNGKNSDGPLVQWIRTHDYGS